MIITREEWRKWAESLNPGDKVIVKYGDMLRIGTVKKVTPACWVVVEKYGTYSQTPNFSMYMERGGYKEIVPFDAKLAEKAKKQEEEERQENEKLKVIRAAKNIAHDWAYGKCYVSYDLAKKIIALDESEDE